MQKDAKWKNAKTKSLGVRFNTGQDLIIPEKLNGCVMQR